MAARGALGLLATLGAVASVFGASGLSSCGLRGGQTGPNALGGSNGHTIVINRILPEKPLQLQSRACVGHTAYISDGTFTNTMLCVQFPDEHNIDFLPTPPSIDREGLVIAFVRQTGTQSTLCMGSLNEMKNNTNKGVICTGALSTPVSGSPSISGYSCTLATGSDNSKVYFADYQKMEQGTFSGVNTQTQSRISGTTLANYAIITADGENQFAYYSTKSGSGLEQEVCTFNQMGSGYSCNSDMEKWVAGGISRNNTKNGHTVWSASHPEGTQTKTMMCRYPMLDGLDWGDDSDEYNCSVPVVFSDPSGEPLTVVSGAMGGSPMEASAVMLLSGKPGGFGTQWSGLCWASDVADGAVTKPQCHQFGDSISDTQGGFLPVSDTFDVIFPFNNGTICRAGRTTVSCVDLMPLQPRSSASLSTDSSTWAVGGVGPEYLVCSGTMS